MGTITFLFAMKHQALAIGLANWTLPGLLSSELFPNTRSMKQMIATKL
jgi:hypothetical protein